MNFCSTSLWNFVNAGMDFSLLNGAIDINFEGFSYMNKLL